MINRVTNFQANSSMNTRSKTSFCSGKTTTIKKITETLGANSERFHLDVILVNKNLFKTLCSKVRNTKKGDVFEFSKDEVIKRTVNKQGNTVLTHIVKKPREHTTVKTVLINDTPPNSPIREKFNELCDALDELKRTLTGK